MDVRAQSEQPEPVAERQCVWAPLGVDDVFDYRAACGIEWGFLQGTPAGSGINFCWNCGGRVIVERVD